MRRRIACIISFALIIASFSGLYPSNDAMAAKKPVISKSKLNLTEGQKKAVTIKNVKAKNMKSIKWTTSKKKVATVKKKSATKAEIKAVKAGKATVKVSFKMKGKTYKLSVAVTVKKADKANVTALPTALPTAVPTTVPTAAPTVVPSATPEPTTVPDSTKNPGDTTEPTKNPGDTTDPTKAPGTTSSPDVPGTQNPTPTLEPGEKEIDDLGRKTVQVKALNQLIATQNTAGAKIPTQIDNSEDYRWSQSGELEKISWTDYNLQSRIDFSAFPELLELYLSSSDITDSDKQNPRLNGINIDNNTKLVKLRVSHSNINMLDVSNCKDLIELECENNNLNELNVTNNTGLILLKCSENSLVDLDLTKLTSLTILECESNEIDNINVQNNTELRILKCGYNGSDYSGESSEAGTEGDYTGDESDVAVETKCLDLGNNTKLEEIYVNDSYLTEIKIQPSSVVTVIDISGNYIEGFDASNYPNLKSLNVAYNEELVDISVAGLNKLEDLHVNCTMIAEIDVTGCESLSYMDITETYLEALDLSDTKITLSAYKEGNGEKLGYCIVIDADTNMLLTPGENEIVEIEASDSDEAVRVTFAPEQE